MRLTKLFLAASMGLALAACSDKDTALQDSLAGNTVDVISNLDFGNNVIPFPNNILLAGSLDGTINIPVEDAADLSDPAVAMNAQDGFSSVAPITTGFTGAIDDASFPAGVKMYEVTADPSTSAVLSVDRELTYGVEFVAALSSIDTTNSSMAILPLSPLTPKQTYMVVITNDLKSESGNSVGISGSYALTHGTNPLHTGGVSNTPLLDDTQAQQLEPLRQLTVAAEAALSVANGPGSSDIILSWNFKVQSTTDVLSATRATMRGGFVQNATFGAAVASPLTLSTLRLGTIDVPYYLTASSTASSPSNDPTALGSVWKSATGAPPPFPGGDTENNLTQFNPIAAATSTQTIPMMVTIPVISGNACGGAVPAGGWPVVIYQHGITTNRASVLAIADAMAAQCMAVVALDMPMHGLTGNESNGTEAYKTSSERTFDLDLVTEDAEGNIVAAEPNGVIDSSGAHFINLSNLQNTRDNVRQAVSDLFTLVAAIEDGELINGADTMNANQIYFLGHSLGAMVGTTFVALEPSVKASVFASGGASLAKILDGSATFGPTIAAGLAANGVNKGTVDYEAFIVAAQTLVDSADPVNYATTAATGRGILFFEIVGSDGSPSDLVVPNTVPDANDTSGTTPAPLAGTEPQLALMGLTQVNTSQTGTDLKLVTKFVSGEHSSLLDNGPDPAVTAEMQAEAAKFLVTNGTDLTVVDSNVLQAP
ncbi:hypothetical protein MNBD_GAMMA08-2704 [hydrothermal vent metagenome]|uniref:Bacterial virulence factor lipase N-terminal domain-containing protein n=1 Tax=hydrothermal vent metagenome TaxID=652676 RepID=A0A3B0YHG3_9ZZZZ